MKIEEALMILEFLDVNKLPKLKEIQKQFRKLSKVRHPDRNGGTKEATSDFQKLLDAYQVAGKAAERVKPEDDDQEEVIAQQMFKEFQFNSAKINSQSITIKTEKAKNSCWMEILTTNLGQPTNQGNHGKKFVLVDKCDENPKHIFLTLYHTGSLLIQAEYNLQSMNIHFLNCHLKDFYIQVYNQEKLKQKIKTLSFRR